MIVARPWYDHEPDLLAGCESLSLIVKDLDGNIVGIFPPPSGGWTHDALESFDYDALSHDAWDAYLGCDANWIGSSEV
ncbi:hypothetical protein [Dickeya parazeae]|uniref:hypothetical protein n=1 Tax=Dickeya parazeae TaxID=2893572 RepID=UPI001AEC8A68|nr:hypothetical protein [Dickeya parazeae]MBP2834740.1 hypothetical protein [Dickeya parazeae]